MDTEITTIRKVSKHMKLREKMTYCLVFERELPGFKVGGSWRFKRKDLEKYIGGGVKWY